MICIDELLSMKKTSLKREFIELLFKEDLITQAVYYKAIELLEKENNYGNTK